jgi:hypothetical protein
MSANATEKRRVLLQLDTDPQPSTFDAVVAADSGVEVLLRHGGVTPQDVAPLVHGAMFTRGPDDLPRTAIFVGGSSVAQAEEVFAAVRKTFFGPFRVSVLLDANGANTTAAAAVVTALRHADGAAGPALVLGATGPVGQRVVWLLASEGIAVRAASRNLQRAQRVCHSVAQRVAAARLEPVGLDDGSDPAPALRDVAILIAAGAAGVRLLSAEARRAAGALRVAIDLNAVPPVGLEGIEPTDAGAPRDGAACYGALGVGGTKMKIHKACIRRLFESNDAELDAPEVLALAKRLGL